MKKFLVLIIVLIVALVATYVPGMLSEPSTVGNLLGICALGVSAAVVAKLLGKLIG